MNSMMEKMYRAVALDKAMDSRDDYTSRHSRNVAYLMHNLAYHMKLSSITPNRAFMAGLVHDIGKMGISLPILNKPGKLTPEEYLVIQQHPVMGVEILSRIGNFDNVLPAVRHHHERYDGKGYPDRIQGEQIPLLSRMLALCDTYDAMTTKRCYRPSTTTQQALTEIQQCGKSQFDPEICQCFLAMMNQSHRMRSA